MKKIKYLWYKIIPKDTPMMEVFVVQAVVIVVGIILNLFLLLKTIVCEN